MWSEKRILDLKVFFARRAVVASNIVSDVPVIKVPNHVTTMLDCLATNKTEASGPGLCYVFTDKLLNFFLTSHDVPSVIWKNAFNSESVVSEVLEW